MTRIVNKRPKALHDLDEITAYIGQDNLNAALSFLESAKKPFNQLSRMPYLGVGCSHFLPSIHNMRFWPIPRYKHFLVLYRPIDNGIEVIRVIHAARDIPRIFQDESS